MPVTKLNTLTTKQKVVIPLYVTKWRDIAISTQPLERQQATKFIKDAYKLVAKREPKIIFFDSLQGALTDKNLKPLRWQIYPPLGKILKSWFSQENEPPLVKGYGWRFLWTPLMSKLMSQLDSQLERSLVERLMVTLFTTTGNHTRHSIWDTLYYYQLAYQLTPSIWKHFLHCFDPFCWVCGSCLLDFCVSELGCDLDQQFLSALESLARHCGWIFPFSRTCLVSERPTKLCFDQLKRLHGEGEAAMEFRDGYQLYANHGIRLPRTSSIFERYG